MISIIAIVSCLVVSGFYVLGGDCQRATYFLTLVIFNMLMRMERRQ